MGKRVLRIAPETAKSGTVHAKECRRRGVKQLVGGRLRGVRPPLVQLIGRKGRGARSQDVTDGASPVGMITELGRPKARATRNLPK